MLALLLLLGSPSDLPYQAGRLTGAKTAWEDCLQREAKLGALSVRDDPNQVTDLAVLSCIGEEREVRNRARNLMLELGFTEVDGDLVVDNQIERWKKILIELVIGFRSQDDRT